MALLDETVTHVLNRSWTLWYDSPSTYNTDSWELSLKPIMTVRTVEDFFLMLRYIKPVHSLRTATQYHFFQENIKPMWEDEANKKGGKIWVNIDFAKIVDPAIESDEVTKTKMDVIWENVLMSLIGESLEDADSAEHHITGVVMTKRKYFHRLALWVKDADAKSVIDIVKRNLITEAGLPPSVKVEFSKHGDKV